MNASHTPRGREGAKPPLNGTKTHPLTEHGFSALKQLRSGPLPAQSFNPGVIDRLLRESLIELKDGPSPYSMPIRLTPTDASASVSVIGADVP